MDGKELMPGGPIELIKDEDIDTIPVKNYSKSIASRPFG